MESDWIIRNQQICTSVAHCAISHNWRNGIDRLQDIWVDIHAGKARRTVEPFVKTESGGGDAQGFDVHRGETNLLSEVGQDVDPSRSKSAAYTGHVVFLPTVK